MEKENETVSKDTTWTEVSLSIDEALAALYRYMSAVKTRSTSITRTKLQEARMWFELTNPHSGDTPPDMSEILKE